MHQRDCLLGFGCYKAAFENEMQNKSAINSNQKIKSEL